MKKTQATVVQAAQQFFPELSDDCSLLPFGKGNINTSYVFKYRLKTYILQKINSRVFPKPALIIENIQVVYQYLRRHAPGLALIQLLPTRSGEWAWIDQTGAYWRLFPLIPNSCSFENAPSTEHAYLGAQAVGRFIKAMARLDPATLHYSLPDFHNSLKRMEQFRRAIHQNKVGRLERVKREVDFILQQSALFQQIAAASLPLRIVHNDAKMDNILFDIHAGRPIGLIDWDTIMPGTPLSDYGDLVRTLINPIPEDSPFLDQIQIDPKLLEAIKKGFLTHLEEIMNPEEKELLPLAPLWITLEQAMRFLTDYLNGDEYYRVAHDEHNLLRGRNQIRLFQCLSKSI